jgi:hypothetical protein
MMAAKPSQLIKTLKDAPTLAKATVGKRGWTDGVDAQLLKTLAAAVKDKKSKGFVTRPDGQARFRYKWGDTTVQFNMYPKAAKTSLVVSHMNLQSADDVETYRAKWKTAFGAIAEQFS